MNVGLWNMTATINAKVIRAVHGLNRNFFIIIYYLLFSGKSQEKTHQSEFSNPAYPIQGHSGMPAIKSIMRRYLSKIHHWQWYVCTVALDHRF